MGRPRKPNKIKEIEGNRGKRKLLPEPEPPAGCPIRPRHLTGLSRTLWDRLTRQLDALGLVTKVDGTALEGICVAYGRAVAADEVIRKNGLTAVIATRAGSSLRIRLEVVISRDCWSQVKAFCVEFGLTPSSRSKLSIQGKSFDDDLESLISTPPVPGRGIQ